MIGNYIKLCDKWREIPERPGYYEYIGIWPPLNSDELYRFIRQALNMKD